MYKSTSQSLFGLKMEKGECQMVSLDVEGQSKLWPDQDSLSFKEKTGLSFWLDGLNFVVFSLFFSSSSPPLFIFGVLVFLLFRFTCWLVDKIGQKNRKVKEYEERRNDLKSKKKRKIWHKKRRMREREREYINCERNKRRKWKINRKLEYEKEKHEKHNEKKLQERNYLEKRENGEKSERNTERKTAITKGVEILVLFP